MTQVGVTGRAISPQGPLEHPSGRGARQVLRRLLRRPGAVVSLAMLSVIVVLSICASLIAPYSPTETHVLEKFLAPNTSYLLGTDELGRDLLSRVLYGGRLALVISGGATVLATALGIVWGGIAAVRRGWLDDVLMRIADATMAVPTILAAIIFVAAFGSSVVTLIFVIGLLEAPWTARVVRAGVLAELQEDYCLAARSLGATKARILFSEVLPNIVPTLMVQSALNLSVAILIEAALSFFGLGVQPPRASWGTLLLEGYRQIYLSPTYAVVPGVMIFVTIWSLNSLSDSIQAVLQPDSQR